MPPATHALLSYLAKLTGERPELAKAPHEKLPLYLRKRYGYSRARILGRDWILAIETVHEDATPGATYASHADVITSLMGKPTVLVLPGLQTRTRQKLIQLRVPFIVPERQTFLPLALVDLRERQNFQRRYATKRLTPAAQVVLLYHLERENLDGWPLKRIALATGYSPIMLSKVRAELEATGLCHTRKTGRTISLAFRFADRELWDKANVHIEVWSYDPCVLTDRDIADPLSVYLTLREVPDERVQEQLETLLKRVSWSKACSFSANASDRFRARLS